jgi:hypothetical protein
MHRSARSVSARAAGFDAAEGRGLRWRHCTLNSVQVIASVARKAWQDVSPRADGRPGDGERGAEMALRPAPFECTVCGTEYVVRPAGGRCVDCGGTLQNEHGVAVEPLPSTDGHLPVNTTAPEIAAASNRYRAIAERARAVSRQLGGGAATSHLIEGAAEAASGDVLGAYFCRSSGLGRTGLKTVSVAVLTTNEFILSRTTRTLRIAVDVVAISEVTGITSAYTQGGAVGAVLAARGGALGGLASMLTEDESVIVHTTMGDVVAGFSDKTVVAASFYNFMSSLLSRTSEPLPLTTSPTVDLADQITRLHQLLEQGALTPVEFEAAKRRVLGL